MFNKNGADILVHLLERQGIRIIAGIPGGMNLPLYDALSQSTLIRHVLSRHEQGAGFMAQGMARATGKPAVCFATSGPGATNILTAIADAKLDSIPVICITGQVSRSMIGTDAFQEVDTYGMSIPITKHNFLVRDAEELFQVIPEAFRIATSGRPGPVLIDVPKDVQTQIVEFAAWPEPGQPDTPAALDRENIKSAAQLINLAQRPMLYLGGGVVHAEAAGLVKTLAEKADIPCVMSLMALGVLPFDHPLRLGLLGMHGSRYANQAVEACDVLIALGSRFGDRATGKISQFCPKAKIVHLDIDASEINKIKKTDCHILGHLAASLTALLPHIEPKDHHAWLTQISEQKHNFPLYAEAKDFEPAHLIRLIGSLLEPNAIIATDVGQHQMWTAQNYPHCQPRNWMTSSGLGTMGFGLPAAIGASLAYPERTVVSFSGDGSLLMNIQELATVAEENLNVKVILFDNQALGLVHQQQDLFYQQRFFASKFKHHVDFVQIARGFGITALTLPLGDDPKPTLHKALHDPGPCLVHIPIDVNQKVFPMVPPGAANTEMLGGDFHVIR